MEISYRAVKRFPEQGVPDTCLPPLTWCAKYLFDPLPPPISKERSFISQGRRTLLNVINSLFPFLIYKVVLYFFWVPLKKTRVAMAPPAPPVPAALDPHTMWHVKQMTLHFTVQRSMKRNFGHFVVTKEASRAVFVTPQELRHISLLHHLSARTGFLSSKR